MKEKNVLSNAQRKMVVDHIKIVEWLLKIQIHPQAGVEGLGYDDLFQVGCVALCEAALSYDINKKVKFGTYAQTVVARKLIDWCRKMSYRKNHQCYLMEKIVASEDQTYADLLANTEDDFSLLNDDSIFLLLQEAKGRYSGIARKGIEALELKLKGYTGTEIASIYQVKPNLVGAWISRAQKYLREDPCFQNAAGI